MEHTDDDSRKLARRLTQQITDGLAEHQRVGSGVFGADYQENWDSTTIYWEPQYEKSDRSTSTNTSKSDRYSRSSGFEAHRAKSLGPITEPIDASTNGGQNPSMDKIYMASNELDGLLLDGTAVPINLPLALLQQITGNFDDSLKIGQGGFAVVYKGVLRSGCVAVKKLLNNQTIEEGPFYRETSILMSVKHPNIARFMGYCANTENVAMKIDGKYIYYERRERLLCFEYIVNGSLESRITDELRGLEWHTRYQIIKGICEGLKYLHKEKGIVHMDLKPANVLLDDLLLPKITDFGISKDLYGVSHVVTMGRLGTHGYCAPEYIHYGDVSLKSDIFSLGIIFMDLVTGRKEDPNKDPNRKNILRRWRYRWNKSGNHPPLGCKQVIKCIEIAGRCTSDDTKRRPDISDIVSWLNETESIGDADESSVGPILRPYSWELLDFDPLELHFPFEINKEISCPVQLTNTRDHYVKFHIQLLNSSSTKHYRIEPNRGIVPPQSKTNVMVILQAQNIRPHDIMGKDEFVVRCTVVKDGLMAHNISKDMFDGMSGDVVDMATLTAAFAP
ncbi:unnamed protein product [Alopecurus aequalis]